MVFNEVVSVLGDLPVWFMQFTVYDLFAQWEYFGIFDLLLPFLLIFALIFGILTTTNILGGHRGVNLVIALVIALMALRLGFVQVFFTELFPRFALGLVALLVIVCWAVLFIHPQSAKGWYSAFAIAGAVLGIIVLIITAKTPTLNWLNYYFWQDYLGVIIGGIILVILIIAIFVTARPKPDTKDWTFPFGPLRVSVHDK